MKTFIVIYYVLASPGSAPMTGTYEKNFHSIQHCVAKSTEQLAVMFAKVVCIEKDD